MTLPCKQSVCFSTWVAFKQTDVEADRRTFDERVSTLETRHRHAHEAVTNQNQCAADERNVGLSGVKYSALFFLLLSYPDAFVFHLNLNHART